PARRLSEGHARTSGRSDLLRHRRWARRPYRRRARDSRRWICPTVCRGDAQLSIPSRALRWRSAGTGATPRHGLLLTLRGLMAPSLFVRKTIEDCENDIRERG